MQRTRINPRNDARAAEMRARNFPDLPASSLFCFIAHELRRWQATNAGKGRPLGWSDCRGIVGWAHAVHTRGMGGVGSNRDEVVPLCQGHHGEQEGKTAAFEALYRVDLAAEAARIAQQFAAGEPIEPGAPA